MKIKELRHLQKIRQLAKDGGYEARGHGIPLGRNPYIRAINPVSKESWNQGWKEHEQEYPDALLVKTHKEFHEKRMQDRRYRFWRYLYWPYFKIVLPLWMKATRRLRGVEVADAHLREKK